MSSVAATALCAVPLVFAWAWRPRQPVSRGAWLLIVALGVFGVGALWFGLYNHLGESQRFVTWKPTLFYWVLAAIAGIAPLFGCGYPVKAIVGTYFALSDREWRWINLGFASLCTALGGLNLWVASEVSYGNWDSFKSSCLMTIFIIVVFRLNFVWLPILADVCIDLYRRTTAAYRYLSARF